MPVNGQNASDLYKMSVNVQNANTLDIMSAMLDAHRDRPLINAAHS